MNIRQIAYEYTSRIDGAGDVWGDAIKQMEAALRCLLVQAIEVVEGRAKKNHDTSFLQRRLEDIEIVKLLQDFDREEDGETIASSALDAGTLQAPGDHLYITYRGSFEPNAARIIERKRAEQMKDQIRNYRIWFKVFDSRGIELAGIADCPELNDIIENGMVMSAYSAGDVIEQSKLEAFALMNKLPSYHAAWPIRVFAYKVRPDEPKAPPRIIKGFVCLHPGERCRSVEEAAKREAESVGFGSGHSFLYEAESPAN